MITPEMELDGSDSAKASAKQCCSDARTNCHRLWHSGGFLCWGGEGMMELTLVVQ